MNETNLIISEEVAMDDFNRMLRAARVKWDLYKQVSGQRDAENERAVIVDAIMDGRVIIDDNGFPTVRVELDSVKEIKITRRGCRGDWLMIDRVKEGHNSAAQNAVMGKFLGVAPAVIELLEGQDFTLIQALWWIFLGYRV